MLSDLQLNHPRMNRHLAPQLRTSHRRTSLHFKAASLALAVLITGCAGSNQTDMPTEEPATTLFITVDTTNTQAVSPHFYGQNYWNWVRQWGRAALEGSSEQVATLGIQLLRAGGINNDNNNFDLEYLPQPEPFNETKLDEFVAYVLPPM